jgi:hypothetical protein
VPATKPRVGDLDVVFGELEETFADPQEGF